MLMKTRSVDFHHVEEHQRPIDDRLKNWGYWLMPRQPQLRCPMFSRALSQARQWHPPEYRQTCDILDAQLMEKMVCALPEKHRQAIQWAYVWNYTHKVSPTAAAKYLGVSLQGLYELIRNGRQMLINRLAN